MQDQVYQLKKTDILAVLIAGEIVGWGIYPISQVLKIKLPFAFWILPVFLPIFCAICLLLAYLIGKKIPFVFQLAKFAVVGLVNTAIDFSILNLLMMLTNIIEGPMYSVFKSISFLVAVTNSFFWNKFWTFRQKSTQQAGRQFLTFFVVSVIGFGLNVGTASFVTNLIGPQFGIAAGRWANIGAVGGTLVAMVENFLGYKFIVFRKRREQNGN